MLSAPAFGTAPRPLVVILAHVLRLKSLAMVVYLMNLGSGVQDISYIFGGAAVFDLKSVQFALILGLTLPPIRARVVA